MPHELKVLHSNNFGFVAICNDCRHFHIELGSFLTVINETSFHMIVKDFQSKKKTGDYFVKNTPTGKKMIVQITDNVFITLTYEEFDSSLELLEMSAHLLSALSLITPES